MTESVEAVPALVVVCDPASKVAVAVTVVVEGALAVEPAPTVSVDSAAVVVTVVVAVSAEDWAPPATGA